MPVEKDRKTHEWSEERVARLESLYLNGFSARQIADDLGQGVTRNAVIGKIHRTPSLKDRRCRLVKTKITSKKPTAQKIQAPKVTQSERKAPTDLASKTPHARKDGLEINQDMDVVLGNDNATSQAVVFGVDNGEPYIPEDQRISLMDLNENTCKWPIGDPLNSDFHFCGHHSLKSKPYCDFHTQRACHMVNK